MNELLRGAGIRLALSLCTFVLATATAGAEDQILSATVQDKLGYEDTPVVRVEVEVDTQRDLHVAFQEAPNWRGVKATQRRIKQSGKYHFEVPFDKLEPGRYRISAYLTPRRKNWNDRIGQPTFFQFEVLDTPHFESQPGEAGPGRSVAGSVDKVMQIKWPKEISGSEEATLEIKYTISEPRDIYIRLSNSENWKQVGEMTFPVTESGEVTVPLANLTSDFPPGKYAWIVWITESGTKEPPVAKLGKHFVLTE